MGAGHDRYTKVYNSALHCAKCKAEFPSDFKMALHPLLGPNSPGYREFGKSGGLCPHCGCDESVLIYEHFPPDKITPDDVLAIDRYGRQRAKQWWETAGRTTGICDYCNAAMSKGEGFLRGSYLICDHCIAEKPISIDKLKNDPNYYGNPLLRKARGFRRLDALVLGASGAPWLF